MKILALDTSSRILSVAIADESSLLFESERPADGGHSSSLAPEIDGLLRGGRLGWDDIDVIAVGLGPGSFTGLRVGMATAKTLAWSLGKKLVGVASLEAVAAAAAAESGASRFAVLLDAKRGQFYGALYEKKNGSLREKMRPAVLTPAELARWPEAEKIAVEGAVHPRARFVASIGARLFREKKFLDPFRAEPLYLHPRDCNATIKPKTRGGKR
ncbi:MAG TPA: tRNA (adenosine(37)-N6)-threonylcarbamoyltransferase complex dimerization subunit type 1 TsaB [Candidatus Eisenbacteria bacterium]|nr:tRNA (adenosine(37)-N6)-threonylcarbamoyltransferase complex dimerization subunit type 1 TsaB [Candidatus Eisenbacteria bacterium]